MRSFVGELEAVRLILDLDAAAPVRMMSAKTPTTAFRAFQPAAWPFSASSKDASASELPSSP